ncbi:MAG: hypothetical protein EPN82_14620, partial [Bacteroidetes bacterium]
MKKLFRKDEQDSKTKEKPAESKSKEVDEVLPPEELEQEKEQVPAVEKTLVAVSSDKKTEAGAKPVPENKEISNKQKIAALKRTLLNKNQSLDRERRKVNDWRSQAETRNSKATKEYEKRKSELEEMLRKSEERYQKRIAKTQK